jgi:hypothetical protein
MLAQLSLGACEVEGSTARALNQATTQTVLILFRRIVDALSVGVFLIMVAASPVFLLWHAMREIWWLLPLDGFGVILLVWLFWRFANRNAKPC